MTQDKNAPTGGLVGRQAELRQVDQVLMRTRQGVATALHVVGEPGIGKTRLLSELCRRARERGFTALAARAGELAQGEPFGLVVEALEPIFGGPDTAARARLPPEWGAGLGVLLPPVRSTSAPGAPTSPDERYLLHRAVRDLVNHLAARQPLLLAFDDVHWADAASLELLASLLWRAPNSPTMLAYSTRTGQTPAILERMAVHAQRENRLEVVELQPLDLVAARQLVGPAVSPTDVAELYRDSGGNPFYLEQLMRSAAPAPDIIDCERTRLAADVPPAVLASLSEELAGLTSAARLLMDGASVLGDPFDARLAAAAAGIADNVALPALDELEARELVKSTDASRDMRFRHPLVRRAVYEMAGPGWLLAAHARVAQVLAERGAPLAARAHHVALSAAPGELSAVRLLVAAGEETMVSAPAIAARCLENALRLCPMDGPQLAQRVHITAELARALSAVGEFERARSTLLSLIALLGPDDQERRVSLVGLCAGLEHLLGQHELAHRRLVGTLDACGDPESPHAVALMLELSWDGFHIGDVIQMHAWAMRALTAALAIGDRSLAATAAAMCPFATIVAAGLRGARAEADIARLLVDDLCDEEVARRPEAPMMLALGELYLEQFTKSCAHVDRAIATARATGQGRFLSPMLVIAGMATAFRGNYALGVDLESQAVEIARLSGGGQAISWALQVLCVVAALGNQVDVALRAGRENLALARDLDDNLFMAMAGSSLAVALIEHGDHERGVELMLRTSGGPDLPLVGFFRGYMGEALVRGLLACGRRTESKQAVNALVRAADQLDSALTWSLCQQARAGVLLADGSPAEAARMAVLAAETAADIGALGDVARALLLAGRAWRAAGRRSEAVAMFERAARDAHDGGAAHLADDARRELRRLGRRVRRPPVITGGHGTAPEATLSDREREIAELVARHRTNREIAATLFLSEKTVETHLRNIFQKLHLSSRRELAGRLRGPLADQVAPTGTPADQVW